MSTPGARVYASLSGSSTLEGYVSTRIHAVILPQEETLPAIVYTMQGGTRAGSLAGDGGFGAPRVQVDLYIDPDDFDTAEAIFAAIRTALSNDLGAVGDDPTETWDPDPLRIRMTSDFVFSHDGND